MLTELRTAIAGKTITGLTGGLWYLEASGKSFPYAVFSFISNPSSRDSVNNFEDYYLQINLYDTDGSRIETTRKTITDVFDDSEASFSLANYHFERIERQFSRALKVDKVYQIVIQYKIELTHK